MEDSALQERLRAHAQAFDGLLSLIPAKMYYGEDTSDQWRKKKQTKDEARAAKRGKLDPDSELNRNAKEVLDERARNKRKLQEMEADQEASEQDDDDSELSGIERERPGEGLKKVKLTEETEGEEASPKKQKVAEGQEEAADNETASSKKQKAKEEKKLAKKQKQEEAKRLKEEGPKKEGKSVKKADVKASATDKRNAEDDAEESAAEEEESSVQQSTEPAAESDVDEEMVPIDVSGLADEDEGTSANSSADSTPGSPIFDTAKNASVEAASTTTSISSAVPPSEKPKYLKIPADTTALRARLEAKLAALRASRKADDNEGKPIRTRQDLIESRRKKQAQSKAHKKELRRLAKEEQDRKREEALASARNSPGLSPLFERPDPHDDGDDDRGANNFAFGRLAFSDGTQLSHDASYEKAAPGSATKKKGPADPKTALLKLEAQKKRLANLDEDKRKSVLEKETWLAARRRAEGEKVHDSESLLKKALKRKEKAKKKSEREWKERAEGVAHAVQERQRKREDNLRKRRDEKAAHRAGGGKKKNKGVQTKKKNRPGFEGGFGGGRK